MAASLCLEMGNALKVIVVRIFHHEHLFSSSSKVIQIQTRIDTPELLLEFSDNPCTTIQKLFIPLGSFSQAVGSIPLLDPSQRCLRSVLGFQVLDPWAGSWAPADTLVMDEL